MCSRRLSTGPWWWPRLSLTTAVVRASLVLLGVYFSRFVPCCCLQARDALHHGWHGQEVQCCAIFWQLHVQGWFAGDPAPRDVFLPFVWPKMLRIMAGTHRKDSCPRRTGNLDCLGDDFTMFPYAAQ